MKRVTSVFLIFLIGLFIFSGTVFAAPPTTSPTGSPTTSPTGSQTEAPAAGPKYDGDIDSSVSAVLIDANSGKVLFEQKADDQIKPASTTKIMTCILAIENTKDLSQKVTIPQEGDWSNRTGDLSRLNIKFNEQISMEDLLTGMMLKSGDDAADAIAVLVGGSKDKFVDMMNAKAKEIGMSSSHFANAGGLDKEDPVVTARDMSKLAVYAMKNDKFSEIVKKATYDMPATNKTKADTIQNTNKLLDSSDPDYYQYATGIKTGSTPKAGGCLVASATKDGMNLICLVYGEKKSGGDYPKRFSDPKSILQWGFENFETVKLSSLLTNISKVQIPVDNAASDDSGNGVIEFAPPDTGNTFITLSKTAADNLKNGKDSIDVQKKLNSEKLKAPVEKGIKVGSVIYKSKATGEVIYTQDLVTPRDVQEAGTTATDGQSPVATLAPTPPTKINTASNNSFVWVFILIPVGLIVFLVVRLMMTHRNKAKFRKYRKPHYSYRIK